MAYQSAGQILPNFPGKGAKPGWYNVEGVGSRYYAGGNEFRNSGDGAYNVGAMVTSVFQPKPLSPERQARSDAQARFNAGDRSALDAYYPRQGKQPKQKQQQSQKPKPVQLPETYTVNGVAFDSATGASNQPKYSEIQQQRLFS